jgi:predicted nucleic acid-binding protein
MAQVAIVIRRYLGISNGCCRNSPSTAVWSAAFDLARRARSAGISVPATHILIAACARHHQVELEHADSDFSHLEKL